MAEHLSDEEQLESLKKWWKTYGTGILLAILIAVGGWFGWNYWQDNRRQAAEQSAVVYMAMQEALRQWAQQSSPEGATAVASHAETLKTLGEDNLYGIYGAMAVARVAVADDDLDTAADELEWALARAGNPALEALVRLRLAAVEFGREESDRALALLNEPYPENFRALYEELKGDILAARGDNENASAAYRLALESLDDDDSRARAILELKMNELAPSGGPVGTEET